MGSSRTRDSTDVGSNLVRKGEDMEAFTLALKLERSQEKISFGGVVEAKGQGGETSPYLHMPSVYSSAGLTG